MKLIVLVLISVVAAQGEASPLKGIQDDENEFEIPNSEAVDNETGKVKSSTDVLLDDEIEFEIPNSDPEDNETGKVKSSKYVLLDPLVRDIDVSPSISGLFDEDNYPTDALSDSKETASSVEPDEEDYGAGWFTDNHFEDNGTGSSMAELSENGRSSLDALPDPDAEDYGLGSFTDNHFEEDESRTNAVPDPDAEDYGLGSFTDNHFDPDAEDYGLGSFTDNHFGDSESSSDALPEEDKSSTGELPDPDAEDYGLGSFTDNHFEDNGTGSSMTELYEKGRPSSDALPGVERENLVQKPNDCMQLFDHCGDIPAMQEEIDEAIKYGDKLLLEMEQILQRERAYVDEIAQERQEQNLLQSLKNYFY